MSQCKIRTRDNLAEQFPYFPTQLIGRLAEKIGKKNCVE